MQYKFMVVDSGRYNVAYGIEIISLKGKDTLLVTTVDSWTNDEPFDFTAKMYDIEKQIIKVKISPKKSFTFAILFDMEYYRAEEDE